MATFPIRPNARQGSQVYPSLPSPVATVHGPRPRHDLSHSPGCHLTVTGPASSAKDQNLLTSLEGPGTSGAGPWRTATTTPPGGQGVRPGPQLGVRSPNPTVSGLAVTQQQSRQGASLLSGRRRLLVEEQHCGLYAHPVSCDQRNLFHSPCDPLLTV